MFPQVFIAAYALGAVYFEDNFNTADVVVVVLSFITACMWSSDAGIPSSAKCMHPSAQDAGTDA